MGITPTDEQTAALAQFAFGDHLAIEAGAGTGKTSTLRLLAGSTTRRGQYLAFNKAIVTDAAGSFPENVACNTAHSLAYRAIGRRYRDRLNAPRQRNDDIARILGIRAFEISTPAGKKRLGPGYLAGLVMRATTVFCSTADQEPEARHFPYVEGIDLPLPGGERGWTNNLALRNTLMPALLAAWADLQRDDAGFLLADTKRVGPQRLGLLRFGHEVYLKLWQLNGPRIPADFIAFDEAQDANPVMLDIVRQQVHAQLVFVGDSCQAIYGFTGAKNALREVPAENRTYLTQSFRFGPAIAEVANAILARLGADLRLRGLDSIPSTTGPLDAPDAILTRTNAAAVEAVLDALGRGKRPALVGGADDVIKFAEAAADLQDTGSTWHPELACFGSWGEVVAYVADDANGGDLALLVRLVEDFGPQRIVAALRRTCREDQADVVISTAHKAKGREWDRVQLADDFPNFDDGPDPEEFRLLYVAVTRARVQLDYVRVPSLRKLLRPAAATR